MDIVYKLNKSIIESKDRQSYSMAEGGGIKAEVCAYDCNELACNFSYIMVISDKPLDFDIKELEKITYLPEPLKVLEKEDSIAIVRSFLPLEQENTISYFEVQVEKHSVYMTRFEFNKNTGKRRSIIEPMTKSMLTRLVRDLIYIVCKK